MALSLSAIRPATRRLRCNMMMRLYTRNGYNFADRFPVVVAAVVALPVRSCLIDREAIVIDDSGARGVRVDPLLASRPRRRALLWLIRRKRRTVTFN
jgi:ATP-dependent DNA ligase